MTEEFYNDLVEAQQEAVLARIKASLKVARAGRVTRHDNVESLMQHLE